MLPDTTFMHELNDGDGATVDHRLVPLIKFLNRLGVTTVRSIYNSESTSVKFIGTDYRVMSDLLFNHLNALTSHLDGVHLEIFHNKLTGYTGTIEMRTGDLDEVSKRVGCWLEMMPK